jgi:hypothetical protein
MKKKTEKIKEKGKELGWAQTKVAHQTQRNRPIGAGADSLALCGILT